MRMVTHNQDIVRATPQARVLSLEAGFLLSGGTDDEDAARDDDADAPGVNPEEWR
jgi:hypothetical protein